MSVRQGTTLYLCLEDSPLRIQNRLFEITEAAPANVHFCTEGRRETEDADEIVRFELVYNRLRACRDS